MDRCDGRQWTEADDARSSGEQRGVILHAFRKHLAEELEKLPDNAEQMFESYAVTTAALARRLLDYLAIDDLTVPTGFLSDPAKDPLRTVLDRILHFRVLHQDAMTFAIPHEPDLVTLYSDHTQDRDDHLYIRLREYRDVVGRLATDDRYVARHLFRRTVTLTNTVMRTSIEPDDRRGEDKHAEFRKWVDGMVANAWHLMVTLIESGEVTCPDMAVEGFEVLYGDGADERFRSFAPISSGRDLVRGYGPVWWWAPFTSRKMEIHGRERYCMLLRAVKSEAERRVCNFVVTFDSYIEMFQDARRQLDSG